MTNTETLASQTRKTVTAADILVGATYHGGWYDGLGNTGVSVDVDTSLEAIYRRCGYGVPTRGTKSHAK